MIENENQQNLLPRNTDQPKYICQIQYRLVVINVCLAATFCGYSYTYFNTIHFQDFARIWKIQDNLEIYQGVLSFCITIGAAVGAYFSNYIMSVFSRKNTFVFMGIVSIVTLLCLQIQNLSWLIFVRFVQGMITGAYFVIISIYIKQFLPIELVGKYGPLIQLFFVIGIVYSYGQTFLLALFLTPQVYWRIVYAAPLVFISIHLYNVQYKYPYDTPKYLLQTNQKDQARKLMKKFIKKQSINERMEELEDYLKHISEKKPSMTEMKSMDKIKQQPAIKEEENPQIGQNQELVHNNKLQIFAAYHLAVLQQMTAIQVVYIFVGEIVYKVYPNMGKILPVLIHGEGIIAIFMTMQVTKILGRKTILQIGTLGCSIFLFLISFSFYSKQQNQSQNHVQNILIVISLFGLRLLFSLTYAAIYPVYIAEIAQPKAISNCSMLGFIVASAISLIFPMLQKWFGGPGTAFLIFGIYTFFSFLLNFEVLVETKDKIQVQVRRQYNERLQTIKKWLPFK